MNCPICGCKTEIVDTRYDCESVHRVRKCVECGHRFYTAEYESNDNGEEYRRVKRSNKNE